MNENSKNQIQLGTLISYFSIFVNIILGLVYTPWMIKQIGQSDYALYTLATSLITMFAIDFGLSAAVSRFVSKYVAEGDTDAVNRFLGVVYKLYTAVSAAIFIVLLVVFIFLDKIYGSLTADEMEKFRVVYAIAGLYSVVSFPFVTFNGILSAYEKYIGLKLCDLAFKVLTAAFVIVALLCNGGLYSLVIANAVVGLAIIFVKFLMIKQKTPVKVKFAKIDKVILKDIFKFSAWSTIGSFAQNFLVVIAPSIIAMVSTQAQVAVFGFSNSLGGYVCLLATAIDGFFLPQISRIVAEKKKKQTYCHL